MKRLLSSLTLSIGACVLLSSCGENQGDPSYNPAVGPFDENGNYVEAWADNPPKSRRARKTTSNPKPDPKPKPKAKTTSRPKPEPKAPPKTTPKPKPKPKTTPPPKPKPKVTPKPKPKVKPKPKAKPKPKPIKVKPRTIRHVVKKGDTLYGLARKYGTSVSKIQKANGLRGTNIIDGTSLVIPR